MKDHSHMPTNDIRRLVNRRLGKATSMLRQVIVDLDAIQAAEDGDDFNDFREAVVQFSKALSEVSIPRRRLK